METMPVPDYQSLFATQWQVGDDPDHDLRHACQEAESFFVSILLKEGLQPLFEEADESGSHMRSILEHTVEQLARDMGADGAFGIADQFYEQLSGQRKYTMNHNPAGE